MVSGSILAHCHRCVPVAELCWGVVPDWAVRRSIEVISRLGTGLVFGAGSFLAKDST